MATAASSSSSPQSQVPADLEEQLRAFLKDDSRTKLDLPPTEQKVRHLMYVGCLLHFDKPCPHFLPPSDSHERAFRMGLVAVSEGVGAERHAVIYKSNDATAIHERLKQFVTTDTADRLELPPAPEPIRYST
jgi:hypothetical protein